MDMESGDLAPGDSISQDGSVPGFRYSQFTQCPSAPFNTAEAEFLPSQFRCSDSLTTPSLLESERYEYRNGDPCGQITSDLHCSSRKLDAPEEGNGTKCGEHVHSGLFCSDSLGLPFFDGYRGSEERESSPRRIFCDPRLLEEETQVSDFGVSVATVKVSDLLSPIQHLQSSTQAFESDNATEEIDVPSLRKEASKTILATAAELQKSPILGIKQTDAHASTATHLKGFSGFEDYDDIVQRWHNRKRVALAATNHQSSSLNPSILKKLKKTTESTVESGTLHPSQPQDQIVEVSIINDQEDCGLLSDTTSPSRDAQSNDEDVGAVVDTDDASESSLLRRKLNNSCTRVIKTFWQPVTAPKDGEERKWSSPRKYRPGGRQRTMDSWVK